MSRITKQIAEAVANELVLPRKNELKDLTTQLTEYVRQFYLPSIPDNIMIEFNANPDYFSTAYSIRLMGEGISDNYKYYSIGEQLPTSNKTDRFKLAPKQAAIIVSLDDKIADKKKEIEDLKRSIEVAIFNLRTYKNVEQQFPEAFQKLPPTPVTSALAVNIKDIRCKLDKANC